jgi:signal transduction histidine kinase
LNLLSNAVKFTGSGGNIRVSASLDEKRMDENSENIPLHFSVADNGKGIRKEDIKVISSK